MTPIAPILVAALVILAAFFLGFTAARDDERRAHAKTRKLLQQVNRQKRDMTKWVQTNWPDEFAAYKNGHINGYQQGVLQAADLEAQAEAEAQ